MVLVGEGRKAGMEAGMEAGIKAAIKARIFLTFPLSPPIPAFVHLPSLPDREKAVIRS